MTGEGLEASGASVDPGEGQDLAHEGTDRRRVRTATHGDDLDGAHDLGLDQRPDLQARHGHGELGDEGEAHPRHRHALHPVVTVAAENDTRLAAMLAEDAAGMAEVLAL